MARLLEVTVHNEVKEGSKPITGLCHEELHDGSGALVVITG